MSKTDLGLFWIPNVHALWEQEDSGDGDLILHDDRLVEVIWVYSDTVRLYQIDPPETLED